MTTRRYAASFLNPFLGCAAAAYMVLGWEQRPSLLAGLALAATSVAVVYTVMMEFGFNMTDFGKTILAGCHYGPRDSHRPWPRLRSLHGKNSDFLDPRASACGEGQKGGPQDAGILDVARTRCMGRGGLTTKIHALVDANGNPIALKLTEGHHDGKSAVDMLDTLGAGQTLRADRAYDSDALRNTLAARGARANVKPMPRRSMSLPSASTAIASGIWSNASSTTLRRPFHQAALAGTLSLLAQALQSRRPRFEKHDANYLALVKLAAAQIWTRFMNR